MKRLFTVLSTLLFSLTMVQSTPTIAATKKFQSSNWATACRKATNGKKLCRMTRAIRQSGSKSPLLITAVQRGPKNKSYILVLRLPHGMNLPLGVQLQIDRQKARRIAVLSSDRSGAFTRVTLSEKVLGAMKSGNQITVAFGTMDGQRFVIPVSLSGFTAAFTKLKGMR